MAWQQPNLDPVILNLGGPFQIRWYSLLYVGGIMVGGQILKYLGRTKRFIFTPEQAEEFIMWFLLSAVIGARIIYCLVYDFQNTLLDPVSIFQVYKGGLSFHGGLLGAVFAALLFSRKKKIPFWNLTDGLAIVTPVGLAMGRIGNFINGELWGRVTEVSWGVIFRNGGPMPRHPSQLYEFFLEGVVLFGVLFLLRNKLRRDGQISVAFVLGYSLARFIVEFFREPDQQLGLIFLDLSMGQILSIIMGTSGLIMAYVLNKKKHPLRSK